MRFDPEHVEEWQCLAWWNFSPWPLGEVLFANISDAIARLRDIVPALPPYRPGTVAFAAVWMPIPVGGEDRVAE
jgi:hypothetical protein